MEGNAFDDIPTLTELQQAAPGGGNAFDDIAPPVVERRRGRAPTDTRLTDMLQNQFGPQAWESAIKGLPAQAGRAAVSAVTALPAMAMDMGVGARNAVTGEQTPLPSQTFDQAKDAMFGKPSSGFDRAGELISSIMMGSGGASSASPAVRTLSGAPDLAAGTKLGGIAGPEVQVPDNFVTQSQQKKLAAAIKAESDARDLQRFQSKGLVVPPATTNPSVINQLVETAGSKIGTAQRATVQNHAAAQRLAAEANGLNPINPIGGQLTTVRTEAGKDYDALAKGGLFPTDEEYQRLVEKVHDEASSVNQDFPDAKVSPIVGDSAALAVGQMDSANAIKMIRRMRDAKSAAYSAGDTESGKHYGTLATALEDQLDRAMQIKAQDPDSGVTPGMVDRYRSARQRIAIAHSTEDAMQGDEVSIRKLANMYNRGEPLSGNLELLGQFGSKYEKASQLPAKIGSAGVNHLEGGLGLAGMALAAKEGHEYFGVPGAIGGALVGPAYFAGRRGAMNYALGKGGQARGIPDVEMPQIPGVNVPTTDVDALRDLGPTRRKAAALAQAIARMQSGAGPQ